MAVVAQLIFEMAANVARLQSDMQKANSVVSGTMQDMKNAAGVAAKALGAVGVALGVREFADMIKGSAEALDHLRSLSIQTGITVETLSALKGVAKASGADLDGVAGMVNRLEKNMLGAANGNAKMLASFEALGISREELQAGLQNMDAFLPTFAQKLLESGESGNTAAEAIKFLGRAGAQNLPFLEQLAAAGELHAKTTAAQTEEAHQFIVALRQMEGNSAALKREFTVGLLPALNSLVGAFSQSVGGADDAREAGKVFGQAITLVAQVVWGAWSALDVFGKTLGMVGAALVALGSGHPIEAIRILKEGMGDISDAATKAGERIEKMGEAADKLPSVRRKASGAVRGAPVPDETAEDFAGEFADGGTIPPGMWGVVGEAGPEIVSGGTDGVTVTPDNQAAGSSSSAGGGLRAMASSAKSLNRELRQTEVLGQKVGDVLDRAGATSARSLKNLDGVLRSVVEQLVKAAAQGLFDPVRSAAAGLSSSVGSGIVKFAGAFAGGGDIPSGSFGLVGEDGPELMSGPGTIIPAGNVGGGDTHNYFDMRGVDASVVTKLQAVVNQLNGSIEYRALNAVRRASTRRGRDVPF